MSSSGLMTIGIRAMFADSAALNVTAHNIANANVAGYSRHSVALETSKGQFSGNGFYGKAEYSQTAGQHWRVTMTGVAIAGHSDDFLGQYRRNSHAALALRYSF